MNKTLWDWLQLLIVPLVLAMIALVFQRANSRTERQIAKDRYDQDREIAMQRYEQDQQIAKQRYEQDQKIALDKQREDLLQTYLDRISELLLEKSLATSPSDEALNVARVRTLTILFQLDARRIGYVMAFLRAAGLMSTKSKSSIVNFGQANLNKINLSQADLTGAKLFRAILRRANLTGANLTGADLRDADLFRAILTGADLTEAEITQEQLKKARSLQGATMPGGTKHP